MEPPLFSGGHWEELSPAERAEVASMEPPLFSGGHGYCRFPNNFGSLFLAFREAVVMMRNSSERIPPRTCGISRWAYQKAGFTHSSAMRAAPEEGSPPDRSHCRQT